MVRIFRVVVLLEQQPNASQRGDADGLRNFSLWGRVRYQQRLSQILELRRPYNLNFWLDDLFPPLEPRHPYMAYLVDVSRRMWTVEGLLCSVILLSRVIEHSSIVTARSELVRRHETGYGAVCGLVGAGPEIVDAGGNLNS